MENVTKKAICPFAKVNGMEVEFNTPGFLKDPFPTLELLREEAPVYYAALNTGKPYWLVTKYEDALMIFKDPRFSKVAPNAGASPTVASKLFSHVMLYMDGQDHTRLRQLIQKAFTPKLIDALRPRIQEITNDLLDQFIANGKMDIISDYALPLPISMIAELLGIPGEDKELFRNWSNIILNVDLKVSMEERYQMMPGAIAGFTNYLQDIIEKKRANPANDLITSLVNSKEGSDSMNEDELMSTIFLLFAAGYETSVDLIGNGVLALIKNPEQLELLRNDPSLINTAVQEMLRITPPVSMASERYATEDIELNGSLIQKGDLVHISISSANHDADKFTDPEIFDIQRKDNRHISFGYGAHYCLGASLGVVEAEIAINTLIKRIPEFSLGEDIEQLEFKKNIIMPGLASLPIVFNVPSNV